MSTTIVTLLGSTRFKKAFEEANLRESLLGKIVLSLPCFDHADGIVLTLEQVTLICEVALRKIDISHEVLFLDEYYRRCRKCQTWYSYPWGERQCSCKGYFLEEWYPYMGEHTLRELEYTKSLGNKKIRFLSEEICLAAVVPTTPK